MTYHIADMRLDIVRHALIPNEPRTRILVRRRIDRVNLIVGRVPFEKPPREALFPCCQGDAGIRRQGLAGVLDGASVSVLVLSAVPPSEALLNESCASVLQLAQGHGRHSHAM